jgi:predicted lipoprotein with Yx(FWY)xxD motif
MKSSATVVLGIVIVGLLAGGAYLFTQKTAGPQADVALATPPGVTFAAVKVGKVTEVAGASSDQQRNQIVFADVKGMTLYTTDKDTQPGKSSCTGDCVKDSPPFVAGADAKPVGDWSVISRDDGTKQWAWKGKPLYTFSKDVKYGDGSGTTVEGWHLAAFDPAMGVPLPYGVAVLELANAPGQAFVNASGMPLYTFDGDVADDKTSCASAPCADHWIPLSAPQLAHGIGDFTTVTRPDGTKQWAYKGKPLDTFDGDVLAGDVNGIGLDRSRHVAMLSRYFMPAEVTIRPNAKHGGILANAQGMSVYARDTTRFNGTGGHNARGGAQGIHAIGAAIGLTGCDADCLKTWHPLTAPADAQPSGYWTVLSRDDGTKQWAYQGYALYSYAGDKKPDDVIGHDIYDLVVNDDTHSLAPASHGLGLYWRVATP